MSDRLLVKRCKVKLRDVLHGHVWLYEACGWAIVGLAPGMEEMFTRMVWLCPCRAPEPPGGFRI